MLKEYGISYKYREYTEDPLSEKEIRGVLKKLHVGAAEVFRKTDKVAKQLKLTGNEPEAQLIELMAKHPTLLQRPIAVKGRRAVVGRPVKKLLTLT